MANVKKAFKPVVDFLEQNKGKKVSSILEEVLELCSAKTKAGASGPKTFIRDTTGMVVGIFDYYYKRWMPLVGKDAVDYGEKKSNPSGYNSMCKEGVSNWTKQQREAKKAEAKMIEDLEAGKLAVEDIADRRAEIAEAKSAIVETDMGFDTKEGLIAYLGSEGFEVKESVTADEAVDQ